MPLKEEWEKTGNWLFRHRSYLPLFILIFLIPAFDEYIGFDHNLDFYWEIGAFILSLTGEFLRILTVGYIPKGTSGRVTKKQVAEKLNTTGIYSTVRHPLYLANFVIWIGVFVFFRVWWFAVIGILLYWIYYERIMFAEEEFLRKKFGEAFIKWAEKTPAFIPSLKNYRSPELPFSLKTVIKREHTSIFGIITGFTFLEVLKTYFLNGRLLPHPFWSITFLVGIFIYLIPFILKKTTKILDVEGR